MPTPKIARMNGGNMKADRNNSNHEREKVEMDERGDIRLIADNIETIFVVSSKALSLASPVWQAMLSPSSGFRESQSNDIPLPDDNAKALRILLLIAHLRFQDLPEQVCLEDLYELAMLCDKYDTVRLVKPFIAQWVDPLNSSSLEPGNEKWLTITWVFGYGELFVKRVDYLVTHLSDDQNDTRKRKRDTDLSTLMPAGIIESIKGVRRHTIIKMLNVCYEYTHLFFGGLGERCIRTNSYSERQECDAIIYGSFTLGLQSLGLWPQQADASEINYSIDMLRRLLNTIEILDLRRGYHPTCNFGPAFRAEINKVYCSSNLRHSYKRHTFLKGLGRALKDPGRAPPEVFSRLGLSAGDFDPDASGEEDIED